MTEDIRNSWPKTADGTTDWETVFEAGDASLIGLISQAHSPGALKLCAEVVIDHLYQRKDDANERSRLLNVLERILLDADPDDIAAAKEAVVVLLREIKDHRILKAGEYVEKIRREAEGDRRLAERRSSAAAAAAREAAAAKARRRALTVGLSVAVVALAALAFSLHEMGLLGGTEDPKTALLTPSATGKQEPASRNLGRGIDKAVPAPIYPAAVLLRPAIWTFTTPFGQIRRVAYQPIVEVGDWPRHRRACESAPIVFDELNLILDRDHPPSRPATGDELTRIAVTLQDALTDRLGGGVIDAVALVDSSNERFNAQVRGCMLAN